ncbi:SIR2 family protein [Acetohalobium arabaticum]|uniref:Uncharacterized protein n=1 Tax=Acetohalobium arabaticum (strain ATCC 49924 / DSM 5501 / Z-7288) TaxID=574087 RepID=D9QVL4_ACEAZ|nr:SIR2 family protein [Acetohalobium arabaticum]ADL12273.1 hypothetical protein Acear_0733 [Acetohalobium arabaticum DSM 5501]
MNNKYSFLLGAGASVPAGIPPLEQLYELYVENLTKREIDLISLMEDRFAKDDYNFNLKLLLKILNLFKELDQEPIKSLFINTDNELINNLDLVSTMIKKLKRLIRKECTVEKSNIDYLLPLRRFIYNIDSLQVFTLNYDLLIETLCELYQINYTDGFRLTWQPDLLEDKSFDLRLYKLHGSSMWYETEDERKLKIPVTNYDGKLEYFLGTELSNLLVYPKKNSCEPFQKLLHYFGLHLLETEILICIGYSFGDSLIKQQVLEGLKNNPQLHIYLVSPHAEQTLEEHFSCYKERITFFNLGIEEALADDFLYFKVHDFRNE